MRTLFRVPRLSRVNEHLPYSRVYLLGVYRGARRVYMGQATLLVFWLYALADLVSCRAGFPRWLLPGPAVIGCFA